MNQLYNEAKMAWGVCMPKQIKRLQNRDDEHVRLALNDILNDFTADNWPVDSKIAWRILTRRFVL